MNNYSCFYCKSCAEKKGGVLCCPELQPRWEENSQSEHIGGEEHTDSGAISRFNRCFNTATDVLKTVGGTPELRFSPALDFGWQDPTKLPASYGH